MVSISKETWSVIVLGIVSGLVALFLPLLLSSLVSSLPQARASDVLTILSMILFATFPGIVFGIAITKLASMRRKRTRHKVAWIFASWVSQMIALVFYGVIIWETNPTSSTGLLDFSLMCGGAGLMGGAVLLIASRVLIGKITIKEAKYFLSFTFIVPAIFIFFTGLEENWITPLPLQYFLFVMIAWQTAALLFIDTLARRHAPQDVVGTPTV